MYRIAYTPTVRESLYSWLLPAARATANYYYYTVFALALLTLLMLRRAQANVRQFIIVVSGLLATTVLLHAIIEVQPRYHHALVFFVCILAAGLLQPVMIQIAT